MEFDIVTDVEEDDFEESPERVDLRSNAAAEGAERKSMVTYKSSDRVSQKQYSTSGSRRSANRYNRLAQNKIANEIFSAKSDTKSKLGNSEVKKEQTLKRLTKKAIEESGISTTNLNEDQVSITSSAFIRRKINEVAHAALPKSKGDTATKLAETQMEAAKEKAQSAALLRFIDQMETDAITQKQIAEERRYKNQAYDS